MTVSVERERRGRVLPPVPYLDHRIDEVLEVLKRIYELQVGYVPFSWDWYTFEVEPNSVTDLGGIVGEGRLVTFILKVSMPDDTVPDVGPFYRFDDPRGGNYQFEEWTIYEGYLLGLDKCSVRNYIGQVLIYDTTARKYCMIYTRELHWGSRFRIFVRNYTPVKVTVEIAGIEAMVRPYARYYTAEELRGMGIE